VAVANPSDLQVVQTLRDVPQHDVDIVVASKTDILKSITEVYGFIGAVKGSVEELTGGGPDLSNLSQFVQLKDVDEIEATDRHVVNAVDYIFHYAFDQRASDIHIEPKRDNSMVRMRIDGKLNDIYTMPRNVHAAMVSRIKMLARMDIAERRRPQDGRIKTERGGRELELRASTLPGAFGEKMVLRSFDPEVLVQDLGGLGFFPPDRAPSRPLGGGRGGRWRGASWSGRRTRLWGSSGDWTSTRFTRRISRALSRSSM